MTDDREKFIRHVAGCLGRSSPPAEPTPLVLPHGVHLQYLQDAGGDELARIFTQNAEAAGTTVYRCDPEGLNAAVIEAVNDFSSGPVIIAEHDFFAEQGTVAALRNSFQQVRVWNRSLTGEENIAAAEKAEVGVAKAELALAESGTVVLFSHLGSGRSVSLLPTYTITVIRKEDIRPRLTQAMSFLRERIAVDLPPSVNFVSGASSTADIELVRVQGVHGPMAISYIIVD